MHEVVQIKRFAENEKATTESVTHFQFRVFGLLDDEAVVTEIAEGAAAVGLPRD